MIVTTSSKPSQLLVDKAQTIAEEMGAAYQSRSGFTVNQLQQKNGLVPILVATEGELRYYEPNRTSPITFHPSMALVRAKRVVLGEADPLLELSGCAEGDTVLDCTAGLAGDSLVFSCRVGATGSVTALESQSVLYTLDKEGLSVYESGVPLIDQAMRRIRMVRTDHLSYLRQQPDKSVDIIYFDPMFRIPVHDSSAMELLRGVVNPHALEQDSIVEARRVARKSILMKEHRMSGELERLGFTPVGSRTNKAVYGIIRLNV